MLEETISSPTPPRPGPIEDVAARLAAARPRLMRLARLRGVPESQREDIVQETLLTAWRSLANLRDLERFDAWLDGILRNLARHAAQAELAPDPLDNLGDFDLPADEPDPLDDLTQRELSGLIDAALGHLRESARQALELRYLAELPAEEVAARLGVTLNTLDARLSRARRQLRAALSGPLRDQAIELGLELGPADEAGWRDTRIWCRFCGKARMQGILADAEDGVGGRMVLRCPLCYQQSGMEESNIASLPALRGLTSFRAADKRLLRLAQHCLPDLARHKATCTICGASIPARIVAGRGTPPEYSLASAYPHHYFVIAECPCGGRYTTSAVSITMTQAPDTLSFFSNASRLIIEPETLITYDSAPAIRFSLLDGATGDRLIYFADPETLDLRGSYRH